MNKTAKVSQAYDFAKEAHKDQRRKFTNELYFDGHVKEVYELATKYCEDEDSLCVALLHDVIEDCYKNKGLGNFLIEGAFGKDVSQLVIELTINKEELNTVYLDNKDVYLAKKMINMSDKALTIKLCDRLQNISDLEKAPSEFIGKYIKETDYIIKMLAQKRRLNEVQQELIKMINVFCVKALFIKHCDRSQNISALEKVSSEFEESQKLVVKIDKSNNKRYCHHWIIFDKDGKRTVITEWSNDIEFKDSIIWKKYFS